MNSENEFRERERECERDCTKQAMDIESQCEFSHFQLRFEIHKKILLLKFRFKHIERSQGLD